MLKITVPLTEGFDEVKQEFVVMSSFDLELEHSLASLSKWEEITEKAFLGPDSKTVEETLQYIKAMTLTADVPPQVYESISNENVDAVLTYVQAKMTATWFSDFGQNSSGGIPTAEVIYYLMAKYNIPFECDRWHLNKLLTLIKVCNQKEQPPKMMSRAEILQRNRALNDQRRTQLNTSG